MTITEHAPSTVTPVTVFVAEFRAAQQAIAELFEAVAKLNKTRNPFSIEVMGTGHYRVSDMAEAERSLRASYWGRIYRETGAYSRMSNARRAEFDRQVEIRPWDASELPDVTEENVVMQLEEIAGRWKSEFDERVCEVFKRVSWDYKTNNPRGLRSKFILEGAIGWYASNHDGKTYSLKRCEDLLMFEGVLWVMLYGSVPSGACGLDRLSAARYGVWEDVHGRDGEPIMRVKGFKKRSVHVELLCGQEVLDEINRTVARHSGRALVW
jgi:hypothetical protein